ncbi:MAG: AmmeMemoRadiSam system protein A [Candidatus Acidiferrales bacterium]
MFPLAEEDRHTLLAIARGALEAAIDPRAPRFELPSVAGRLAEPAGAFVTLRQRGRLRGCVGQMESPEILAIVVAHCSVAAAVEDRRFTPVIAEEFPDLSIEISVLSRLLPVSAEEVIPGTHGLLITRGNCRGVLLPQVARELEWSRERFLEETCLKAGLARDAWTDPATRIEVFTAESFAERERPSRRRAS